MINSFSLYCTMIRETVFLLLFAAFVSLSHAFLWDQFNINRLFGNSDAVFNELSTAFDSDQQACLNEFRGFVDALKAQQGWALRRKYSTTTYSVRSINPKYY